MVKAFVLCQVCGEIFTDQEVKEHQNETKHNHWALLYEGAPMFKLFKKWAIIRIEDYEQLVTEQAALKRKVLKQAEIIAGLKSSHSHSLRNKKGRKGGEL